MPALIVHSLKPGEVTCKSRSLSGGIKMVRVEAQLCENISLFGSSADITDTNTASIDSPVFLFVK